MRFSLITAALLITSAAMGGCVLESGGDGGTGNDTGPPAGDVKTMDIDTGATVMEKGGEGVGIFVEYAPGGAWTVYTSCDTLTSQQACDIDVFVTPVDAAASISNADGTSFQGKDAIELQSDGSLHMFVETSTGLDGMTFSATPDATMQFEVLLDGVDQPQFVYWVGDGVLHTGSPTDPLALAPVPPPTKTGGGTNSP